MAFNNIYGTGNKTFVDFGGSSGNLITQNLLLRSNNIQSSNGVITSPNYLFTCLKIIDNNGVINVLNFGGIPDGVTDNYPLVNNLVYYSTLSSPKACTLVFPKGVYLFGTSLTLSSDVKIKFENGAQLLIPTGINFTINGNIDALEQIIFTGAGNIAGAPLTKNIYNSWFSGVANNLTNIRSGGITTNRPITWLYLGYYYFDTTLSKPVWWNGTVWKDATGLTV